MARLSTNSRRRKTRAGQFSGLALCATNVDIVVARHSRCHGGGIRKPPQDDRRLERTQEGRSKRPYQALCGLGAGQHAVLAMFCRVSLTHLYAGNDGELRLDKPNTSRHGQVGGFRGVGASEPRVVCCHHSDMRRQPRGSGRGCASETSTIGTHTVQDEKGSAMYCCSREHGMRRPGCLQQSQGSRRRRPGNCLKGVGWLAVAGWLMRT
jgi:hypothetical protein